MLSDVLLNLDCAAPRLGLVPWDMPLACGLSLFSKLIENSAVCIKLIENTGENVVFSKWVSVNH